MLNPKSSTRTHVKEKIADAPVNLSREGFKPLLQQQPETGGVIFRQRPVQTLIDVRQEMGLAAFHQRRTKDVEHGIASVHIRIVARQHIGQSFGFNPCLLANGCGT